MPCHGTAQMSGLDLRQRESMLKGGKRGPALVPGDAEESLLFQAVLQQGELKMPLGKEPLSPRRWKFSGAGWRRALGGWSRQTEHRSHPGGPFAGPGARRCRL